MSFRYDLRRGDNTVLRGTVTEEISAYFLRSKYNMKIVRPRDLIRYLEEKETSQTARFLFVKEYKQTMDFFGLWPNVVEDPAWGDRDLLVEFFSKGSLDLHFSTSDPLKSVIKGFAVEVKSRSRHSGSPALSNRQIGMIERSSRLQIRAIVCQITLQDNWMCEVKILDNNLKLLRPEGFDLSPLQQ